VIVSADTYEKTHLARDILLREIGVRATQDLQALFWVGKDTNEIEWVVGYDGFIGSACQMHVVNLKGKSTPRKLLWAAFDYPFNQAGLSVLLGVVNSKNKAAMRYDKHLGFTELSRIPGAHDDGGDIVLFKMTKDECKWLKERKYEAELVAA
jgi:RimJ/RimL family protein N-acetyltransferase